MINFKVGDKLVINDEVVASRVYPKGKNYIEVSTLCEEHDYFTLGFKHTDEIMAIFSGSEKEKYCVDARKAGLLTSIIINEDTTTTAAIGPAPASEIDKITGRLQLRR